MKKLIAVLCVLLLGASLSFAQATGGSTDTKAPKTASGKKATKTKSYAHKGGKKGSTVTPQTELPGAQNTSPQTTPGSKVELNPQPLPPRVPPPIASTKTKSHAKKGGKKSTASGSTKPPSPSEPATKPPSLPSPPPPKSGTNPPPPPPPK
jgi:hypothetical protein